MRIEDIEIHVGEPAFEYQPIRRLEAKCEATMAFSPAPTVDEMNGKLRSMAAKLGANAIIDVRYDSGVSMTSWKSMKGTGLAVLKLSDEMVCPVCAETIKRAATKCRYCGAEIDRGEATESTSRGPARSHPAVPAPAAPAANMEPLRETNNPQMWLIVGGVVFLFLMIIGMASG
jgi:hypothetical protein